jgi:hypothetical protein
MEYICLRKQKVVLFLIFREIVWVAVENTLDRIFSNKDMLSLYA